MHGDDDAHLKQVLNPQGFREPNLLRPATEFHGQGRPTLIGLDNGSLFTSIEIPQVLAELFAAMRSGFSK